MRKGWLIIPGVQDGDRTLDEQMTGVREALAEAPGKTILDLGCAEGLIGREFVLAGAVSCFGIDAIADHLTVARSQCEGLPMTFEQVDFNVLSKSDPIEQFDIVLSLGVAHKLMYPGDGIRYSARAARSLCLIRMSARPEAAEGILTSKHFGHKASVPKIMKKEGFTLDRTLMGPKEESVQYWRRLPPKGLGTQD